MLIMSKSNDVKSKQLRHSKNAVEEMKKLSFGSNLRRLAGGQLANLNVAEPV